MPNSLSVEIWGLKNVCSSVGGKAKENWPHICTVFILGVSVSFIIKQTKNPWQLDPLGCVNKQVGGILQTY